MFIEFHIHVHCNYQKAIDLYDNIHTQTADDRKIHIIIHYGTSIYINYVSVVYTKCMNVFLKHN